MDCEKIDEQIRQMIINLFNVSKEFLSPENDNLPLTGSYFQLSGINLTYLFFEVEKFFGIQICEDDVLDHRFNSINGIRSIVNRALAG